MKKIVFLFVLVLILLVSNPKLTLGNNSTDSAATIKNSAIQNRIEKTKEIKELKKTELQSKIQEKKEEFQLKLQAIKDARKQKIVANLDRSYVNINNRWTTHFTNVLVRLTKILDKVKLKAEEQKNSEALNSISNIYTQIGKVKTAVEEQAVKTYTIEIASEDKLGEAAKTVHSQMKNDLQTLREQIKDIRESIRKVVLSLKQPSVTNQPTP